MKWKFQKPEKEKETKQKTFFQEWRDAVVFAVIVATLVRWSAVEAFVCYRIYGKYNHAGRLSVL